MGVIDWILVSLIAVALVFAIIYTLRHKEKCLGCGGDCTHCKKTEKM